MLATTRWSLVAAAADPTAPSSQGALAELCSAYWYPVYAFIRRQGRDHHQAQDLTQAFFTRLLETNDLAMADPQRGRFRSFLFGACQHFLANDHDYHRALKRGGGRTIVAIDFSEASGRYLEEPGQVDHPDREFTRQWALDLLDRCLLELRREYAEGGKLHLFDTLKPVLSGGAAPYGELAQRLDMTVSAIKVAVHRLKQRYRDRLRAAIAETVATPEEVDDEIRDLFAALGPG